MNITSGPDQDGIPTTPVRPLSAQPSLRGPTADPVLVWAPKATPLPLGFRPVFGLGSWHQGGDSQLQRDAPLPRLGESSSLLASPAAGVGAHRPPKTGVNIGVTQQAYGAFLRKPIPCSVAQPKIGLNTAGHLGGLLPPTLRIPVIKRPVLGHLVTEALRGRRLGLGGRPLLRDENCPLISPAAPRFGVLRLGVEQGWSHLGVTAISPIWTDKQLGRSGPQLERRPLETIQDMQTTMPTYPPAHAEVTSRELDPPPPPPPAKRRRTQDDEEDTRPCRQALREISDTMSPESSFYSDVEMERRRASCVLRSPQLQRPPPLAPRARHREGKRRR